MICTVYSSLTSRRLWEHLSCCITRNCWICTVHIALTSRRLREHLECCITRNYLSCTLYRALTSRRLREHLGCYVTRNCLICTIHRAVKSRRFRWTGHVAVTGEIGRLVEAYVNYSAASSVRHTLVKSVINIHQKA